MYLSHAVQKLELFEIKRLNVAKSKRYYIQNVMVLHGSFFSGYNCLQKNKASYAPVNNDNVCLGLQVQRKHKTLQRKMNVILIRLRKTIDIDVSK